jgi:hypothetical protein
LICLLKGLVVVIVKAGVGLKAFGRESREVSGSWKGGSEASGLRAAGAGECRLIAG